MKKIYNRSIYTKNDAGSIFFMALFLPAVFAVVLMSTLAFFAAFYQQNLLGNELLVTCLSILSAQGGMFFVYFLYNKLLRANPFKASKIGFRLNFKNILISMAIGAATLFGLNSIISVFDALFQAMGHIPKDMPLPLTNGWWLALNLVLLAVVPAIVEELLFRGIIYNGLKQYGKKTAIIVSAVLFALIHGNVDQTVYPILFGIILAYIVYKTDNIVYAMIAHFVNNAIVLVFNFVYTTNPGMVQNPTIESILNPKNISLAVLLLVVTLVSVFFVGKLFKKDKTTAHHFLNDLPETISDDAIKALNQGNAQQTPSGVDPKVWEKIICQKNDLAALQKAKSSSNTMLWVGIAFSVILWLASI